MRIERLFNALVLGGAAMGTGCGDEGASPQARPAAASGGGRAGASASGGIGGEGGAIHFGGTGGATLGDSGPGGLGSSGEGGTDGGGTGGIALGGEPGVTTDAGTAGPTECSPEPNVGDPCGCRCCWIGDCANDEPCCAAFCDSADDGNGCCGP